MKKKTVTKFLPGDIFFNDSTAFYATLVKFLMQSPTVWHWIIGKIQKLFIGEANPKFLDEVRFYHAGMIYNDTQVIEQQKKVELETIENTIINRTHVVWRRKGLSQSQRNKLIEIATADIGKGFDVLLIFGKTLTWLTGIKGLTRVIERPTKEICVTRVAKWYSLALNEKFGKKSWDEVTTDDIDNWCLINPDKWTQVSLEV